MELEVIDKNFSICKISSCSDLKLEQWMFLGYSDEEISLVCPEDKIPENVLEIERGWRAFRFVGILDFSLIGILAPVSKLLADNGIGLFVVSTYNTDYILIKQENFERAVNIFSCAGYTVI